MTITFDKPGQLERPTSDWVRDEDTGRPLIKPDPEWTPDETVAWLARGGSKDGERYYTRVTTFGEALLDGTMLARWKMRRVALGMGRRPDYVVAAAALTAEDRDKAALNDLAEKALEAAGPNAADIGTALHGFSERIDRGEPLGFVPAEYRADLERYREIVEAHLTWRHREERMVCDGLETAGTPDGIALCDQPDPDGVIGLLRIVDLKTGNIETTAGKFSCQLGIYAHSALYDPATGRRTWLADLDTRWGLVLHMPAGVGTAELRWLNLEHGWLGAQVAGPVRKWRTVNHADLMRPLVPPEPRQVAPGKCRGVKRDGSPCTFAAKSDGLCTRHQGQDPDAVVPARVTEVADVLSQAIADIPEPLRMIPTEHSDGSPSSLTIPGQPATESEGPCEHTFQGIYESGRQLCLDCGEPQPATVSEDAAEDDSPDVEAFLAEQTIHPDPRPELNGNPKPHASLSTPETAEEAAQAAELALMDQIRACRTTGELDLLWQATGPAWSVAVKAYAKRHRDLLPEMHRSQRAAAALLAAIGACRSLPELRALGEDPRNADLWTDEAKAAARAAAETLPPY